MSIEEIQNQSTMSASLQTGYQTLDGDEKITFIRYTRYVLPIDGTIYFIKDTTADPLIVAGSIHYSTDQQQNVDETIAINSVVFTTSKQVRDFNVVKNNVVYIGIKDGIRFSFTASGKFYTQAGLYHYRGNAIYPAMASQIIDNPSNPISIPQVITNSLPLWLALNTFTSPIPHPVIAGTIYPSYLLPSNLEPPYLSVDISETIPLNSIPQISSTSESSQLMREKVKITTYGLNNNQAIDFLNFVVQYSLEYDNIGILNMPRFFEEKRTQSELGIIAVKKSIEFEISYYQHRSNDVARQLILHCLPNFIFI